MYEALVRTLKEEGNLPTPVFHYLPLCNNELDMAAYQKQYFQTKAEIAVENKQMPELEKKIMERLDMISRMAQSCEQMKEEIINHDRSRFDEEIEKIKREKQLMEEKIKELQEEKEYYQRLYMEESNKLKKFTITNIMSQANTSIGTMFSGSLT